MKVILLSNYWPNLHYFHYALKAEALIIEQHDHYQKQSFRNRTKILTANGVLNLTIPTVNSGDKILMYEVEIDYKENWQSKHWRAITSAYKNSPFFDFFEDELFEFYNHKEQFLLTYNLKQLDLIFKILRKKKNFSLSESFESHYENLIDKRFDIHPKISLEKDSEVCSLLQQKYYQTFSEKFGFVPNLNVLDLIFNEGKYALDYLISE